MESLARLFVAATELVETEGRVLKGQVLRLLVAAWLGLMIVVLAVAGLGLLLFGLFRVLAEPLTTTGAACVVGVVAILLAWGGLACVRRLLKRGLPLATTPDQAAVAEAKSVLACAAEAADPVSLLRKRPFALIGVAAAAGVVLAMSTSRPAVTARPSWATSWFVRLVASAVGRYVVAKVNHSATEMRSEAWRTQALT